MTAPPLLELRAVSKHFGGLRVIDELDLHVDEGEIVSVIGPNGAGKTTLFNLVTGIYRPDAGDILFEGESLVGLEPHQITGRGIARTFQTLRLFLNMTVKENVMAAAYGHTRAGRNRIVVRNRGSVFHQIGHVRDRAGDRRIEQQEIRVEVALRAFGEVPGGYRSARRRPAGAPGLTT